jgi:hypothetical protein
MIIKCISVARYHLSYLKSEQGNTLIIDNRPHTSGYRVGSAIAHVRNLRYISSDSETLVGNHTIFQAGKGRIRNSLQNIETQSYNFPLQRGEPLESGYRHVKVSRIYP